MWPFYRSYPNTDFGTHLHDALRDIIVCGLSNENIQRRLLTEEALTFQSAVTKSTPKKNAKQK